MSLQLDDVFQQFIIQQNLEKQKLLLMISGGVDSMVLLDVALKVVAKEKITVFHLDHGARNDSHLDLKFVQKICTKNKLNFLHSRLEFKASKNIESQWRAARKEAAQAAAHACGAARILTAHHATDLVETMLFRLTKGSGPSGLAPFDTSTKPFWEISKSDLIKYAQTNQVNWQEDSSNLNKNFERNLIRLNVLPTLRKITPNLEAVFIKEAKTFGALANFLADELQSQCGAYLKRNALPLPIFLGLPTVLQTEFLRTIALKSTSQSEIKDALKWLHSNPNGGSYKTVGSTTVKLESGQLHWDD